MSPNTTEGESIRLMNEPLSEWARDLSQDLEIVGGRDGAEDVSFNQGMFEFKPISDNHHKHINDETVVESSLKESTSHTQDLPLDTASISSLSLIDESSLTDGLFDGIFFIEYLNLESKSIRL